MSVKEFIRATLRKAGYEIKRLPSTSASLEKQYVLGGRVPWGPGYEQVKEQFIRETLANPSLLAAFRNRSPLPLGYGVGLDERCVEYPWFLAGLQPGSTQLLDAGSALNHEFLLAAAALREKYLHILTLAPERNCFWQEGISYLFADLRTVPIRDNYYDTIACISTLEHVGCDNTGYTHQGVHRESQLEDFTIVMQEFRRLLKPGGALFLTVPFGLRQNHGSFQQFDSSLLERAISAFGAVCERQRVFYRYTGNGWNVASETDCAACEYVQWLVNAHANRIWPQPIPMEPDRAAAARAVACVRLVKK